MKLNCDMGESYGPWAMGADDALMPHVDMANIACGAHASDPVTMARTVDLALQHQVQIGAHPGYPDKEGFGRRPFPLHGDALTAHLLYQLGALDALCRHHHTRVQHIKPHGALYNQMMRDEAIMQAVFETARSFDPSIPVVVQAGDTQSNARHRSHAAKYGLKLMFEAFADRAYAANGLLVPRTQPGAVHGDVNSIVAQARNLIEHAQVITPDGQRLDIQADTLCLHGDNPLSPAVAQALRNSPA